MLSRSLVRTYYGGIASVSDDRLDEVILLSKRAVELDGVAQSHVDFDRLHMLRIGVDLPGSATANMNGVVSKSIDGVSTSFGTMNQSEGSLLTRYQSALNQVVGFCHRVA